MEIVQLKIDFFNSNWYEMNDILGRILQYSTTKVYLIYCDFDKIRLLPITHVFGTILGVIYRGYPLKINTSFNFEFFVDFVGFEHLQRVSKVLLESKILSNLSM